MKDIFTYFIILLCLGILRSALPRLKTVKTALIKRTVAAVEKKITGSGRGAEKKAKAIKRLKWLGVKADETTGAMIDIAVEAMNAKNGAVKVSLKEAVTEQLETGMENAGEAIKSRLQNGSGEEKK